MKILTEISAGELFDKLSILEIKLDKINDNNKKKEIKKEFDILKKIQTSTIKSDDELENLFNSLKKINNNLWEIEDKIRIQTITFLPPRIHDCPLLLAVL